MTDIEESTKTEAVKDYREFTTKSKVRLIVFCILGLICYIVCTASLFFGKGFIIPIISFIFLFILIYFIALDCYKVKFRYVMLSLFSIFLLETIVFIICLGFSRYLVAELVLFNAAIGILLFLLNRQLKNRTGFSPFAYFTEGGFFVTTLLTVFFCVLMVGKYTQIPFTCDDIESFPEKMVETTVNPLKKTWNKISGRFKEEEEETLNIPEFYVVGNPMLKSEELASADSVENFFNKVRTTIKDETVGITNQVSKATCNQYIGFFQKTQKSGGIQIAGIVIGYLLLVGIFKILLWIISVIGFFLFLILRLCGLYKYQKRMVEKEIII